MSHSTVNTNTTIRRARTAYNFYFHMKRSSIKERIERETGKSPTYTQLAKFVAIGWKACGPSEKAYFKELAARDKRRYALEFIKSKTEEEKEKQDQESRGSNMTTDVHGDTTELRTTFVVAKQEPLENVQPVLNLSRAQATIENPSQCPGTNTMDSQGCSPQVLSNLEKGLAQLLWNRQVTGIVAGLLLGTQQQDTMDFDPIQVTDFASENRFDKDAVRHLEQVFGVCNNGVSPA